MNAERVPAICYVPDTHELPCRVMEADVLMATDALGPSNAPDDDGLETPDKILSSQLSTGGASR